MTDRTITDAATSGWSWDQRVRLDAALTVNDTLLRHPETMAVFNAFGVDACCGGAASLAEAARTAGVEPVALIEALEGVIHGTAGDAR